jgi:hypothetical protein
MGKMIVKLDMSFPIGRQSEERIGESPVTMPESVVEFLVDGKKLIGILHSPSKDANKRHVGINILCPGTKHRVGPHRLNVKLARYLCDLGYFVFRFDPSGIGDSEGDLEEGLISNVWGQIQQGLFVKDTLTANRVFVDQAKVEKVTLLGLCGGAITTILTADQDPLVHNVVAIDVPVKISNFTEPKYVKTITSKTYANKLFTMYLKKAFDPKAWFNLLTFRTDYKALAKVIQLKLFGFLKKDSLNEVKHSPNFNFKMLNTFQSLQKKGKKVLFMGAEKEHTTGEFEEEFLPHIQGRIGADDQWEYHVVKNSNHVYALPEWQAELEAYITNWLDRT